MDFAREMFREESKDGRTIKVLNSLTIMLILLEFMEIVKALLPVYRMSIFNYRATAKQNLHWINRHE